MSWFKDHLVSVHCGDKERDKEDVVQVEKVPQVVRSVHRVEAAEDQEQVDEEVQGKGNSEEAEGGEDHREECGAEVGLGTGQQAAEGGSAKWALCRS